MQMYTKMYTEAQIDLYIIVFNEFFGPCGAQEKNRPKSKIPTPYTLKYLWLFVFLSLLQLLLIITIS